MISFIQICVLVCILIPTAALTTVNEDAFVGELWGAAKKDDLIDSVDLSILPQKFFLATRLAGNPGAEVLHFTANDPEHDPSGPPFCSDSAVSHEDRWKVVKGFQHFAYEASKHTIVFVDIQGTLYLDPECAGPHKLLDRYH